MVSGNCHTQLQVRVSWGNEDVQRSKGMPNDPVF
jgi:hypothetical protein